MAKKKRNNPNKKQPDSKDPPVWTRDRNLVTAGDMIMIGCYPEHEEENR